MKLIDRIKNFFNRNKVKSLPEPEMQNIQYSKNNNDTSWMMGSQSSYYQEPLTKLDLDIMRFLNKYSQNVSQIDSHVPINNYRVAYSSLVASNEQITQNQYDYNRFRESELLTNFAISNSYNAIEQGGFYHVKSPNHVMPEYEDMARVYVNCKSENIAEVAKLLTDNNSNPNFYMKFTSNEANAHNPRNEKVVIYCNKNELNYTLGLVQNCQLARPDFFQDSKSLPFLKNEQNIATVAYQPISDRYVGLQGQVKQIPQSVNAFIANMLEESYMEAVREIARVDRNLNFLFDENNYNNETLYIQNYPYISNTNQAYLLRSMKAKLEVLSRKNNISLEGIQQDTLYYNNKSRDDFEMTY